MIVRMALVAAALAAATAGANAVPPNVPSFDHVIVVVFENKDRADVVGSTAAPTFNSLGRRYAELVGYRAVAHPSLPNYLALVSGSTHGIHDDCTDCVVNAVSLADTLALAHRTWKTYAEGLPSPGFTGAGSGTYAKKHDPFLYFANVLRRQPGCTASFRPRALAEIWTPDNSLRLPRLGASNDAAPITGIWR